MCLEFIKEIWPLCAEPGSSYSSVNNMHGTRHRTRKGKDSHACSQKSIRVSLRNTHAFLAWSNEPLPPENQFHIN